MKSIFGTQNERRTFKAIISTTMTVVLLSTASLCAEDVRSGIHALGDADLPASGVTAPETTGCGTNVSARYTGGFDPQHFDWVNVDVDERGSMSLHSAAMNGRPDKVVIPFEQEVFATFISESTAYASNLGWILHADTVDENGHFLGWSAIDERNRHIIFRHVVDDDVTSACCGSGNGILDTDYGNGDFKTDSETVLAGYDDGSGTIFLIDRDGEVTPRDMKKRLGRFAAGSEIVFYLTADKASESPENPPVYFNQPWSQDLYAACVPGYGSPLWVDQARGIFDKLFLLGEAVEEESCQAQTHWLSKPVLDRLSGDFDVHLFGEYRLPLTVGERFAHMIGGVAQNNADQWVYGFEDGEAIIGEPDMDFSDVVFLVDQPNGGSAALSPPHALKPFEAGAFFTTVDLEVCDYQPAASCTGQSSLTYSVSVDLGVLLDSGESLGQRQTVFIEFRRSHPSRSYHRSDCHGIGWPGIYLPQTADRPGKKGPYRRQAAVEGRNDEHQGRLLTPGTRCADRCCYRNEPQSTGRCSRSTSQPDLHGMDRDAGHRVE